MKGSFSLDFFSDWLHGVGGLSREGFFSSPDWVDTSKSAGHTSLSDSLGLRKTVTDIAKLSHFFFTPNLLWFCVAAISYRAAPYDMDSARRGWSTEWVTWRGLVMFAIGLAYYGFFYWSLYLQGLSSRKYRPGVFPNAANLLHDVWYWTLGTVQLWLSECAMIRLWATGLVPFVSDSEVLSSSWQMAMTALLVLAVPVWRDLHFYFAHRFSHIRALYKYVHALHHRNLDPQPFSGLCMHPVEHLIYFSNMLIPTLIFRCSPFIFYWILIHLYIAPGAGHSGWEDHWQADQYHYIHHAKFECNYGSPSSAWLDQFFGTFRDKLGTTTAYKGEYKDDYEDKGKEKVWSAQGYLALQSIDHLLYTAYCVVAACAVFQAAASGPPLLPPTCIAAMVSFGPCIVALLLCTQFDKMNWRWPFHQESVLGAFGFFVVMGVLTCLLPVYRFIELVCAL